MKTIVIASLAVLAIVPAAEAAQRGRLIGNGTNTPREIVEGKQPGKRMLEIAGWMSDNGGKHDRFCEAKKKTCTDTSIIKLTSGEALMMRITQNMTDKSKGYATYCRMAATGDTSMCYSFTHDTYFAQVLDADSKEWTMVWNEREETEDRTADKPVELKQAEIDL